MSEKCGNTISMRTNYNPIPVTCDRPRGHEGDHKCRYLSADGRPITFTWPADKETPDE